MCRWREFGEDAVIAAPPIVSVGLPDTVSCPGELEPLLAAGDDPDEDLDSLEWVAEGARAAALPARAPSDRTMRRGREIASVAGFLPS